MMLTAVVLSVVLVLLVPVASAVDLGDAGYWYITKTGVQEAWKQGVTGKGVRVGVVDTQLVSDYPAIARKKVPSKLVLPGGATSCTSEADSSWRMDVSNPTLKAGEHGYYITHGTEMISYIVGDGSGYDGGPGIMGVAPDTSVVHYTDGFDRSTVGGNAPLCKVPGYPAFSLPQVLAQAIADGNRIINVSMDGGAGESGMEAYLDAFRRGVIIVTASGNNEVDSGPRDYVGEVEFTNRFPGFLAVNRADEQGNTNRRDGGVTLLAPSVGIYGAYFTDERALSVTVGSASQSAAVTSGMLALVMSRWPEATGNQILQSVVRNTKGNTSGEPVFDKDLRAGFGVIDLPRLLSTDPTVYPDINPLLAAAYDNSERHEETKGMYTDHADTDSAFTKPFRLDNNQGIGRFPDAYLIGREVRRQRECWDRVERCRTDGGSDCMRYSATATAGETDSSSSGSSVLRRVPVWAWVAGGGAVAAALAAVICLVLMRRRRMHIAMAGTPASYPMYGRPPATHWPDQQRMPLTSPAYPRPQREQNSTGRASLPAHQPNQKHADGGLL
ncbi:MAG: S8 family serine peptidase [Bifidobacterium animalis]|nr:S8 family serine peptidase [Bifidobacterium animalis]MDY5040357.1 S8 family serine peptidase [Bifidobacterium animalis]